VFDEGNLIVEPLIETIEEGTEEVVVPTDRYS
jgi:hypothetical protein